MCLQLDGDRPCFSKLHRLCRAVLCSSLFVIQICVETFRFFCTMSFLSLALTSVFLSCIDCAEQLLAPLLLGFGFLNISHGVRTGETRHFCGAYAKYQYFTTRCSASFQFVCDDAAVRRTLVLIAFHRSHCFHRSHFT